MGESRPSKRAPVVNPVIYGGPGVFNAFVNRMFLKRTQSRPGFPLTSDYVLSETLNRTSDAEF